MSSSSNSSAKVVPPAMGVVAVLLSLSTALFWGGNAAAVKFSLDAFPPVSVAAVRFGLASLFMLGWCWLTGTAIGLRRKHAWMVGVGAIIHYLQIVTFNFGTHWSNSSHSVILINAFVFLVVAADHFCGFGPRMTRTKWLGLWSAAAGVGFVIMCNDGQSVSKEVPRMSDLPSRRGDLMVMVSAVILAGRFIWIKRAVATMAPANFMLWQFVGSVLLFMATSFVFETIEVSRLDSHAVRGLLYQGLVVGGYCFAIQAILLKRYSATQVAIFSFTTPLFGIAASVLTRDDSLSPWLVLSVVVVSWGIYLVQKQ